MVILVTIPSWAKISYCHRISFCKRYLLKIKDLEMETKILIPLFSFQDFSSSVTRWPHIHSLHGSALTEDESKGKKSLQQNSVVIIIQRADGPFNNQLCIWVEEGKASFVGLKWARKLLNVSRHFSSRLVSIKEVNKSSYWCWALQIVHGLTCLAEKNL